MIVIIVITSSISIMLHTHTHTSGQEHDEQVLAHLTDIKVVYADDKGLVSQDHKINFLRGDFYAWLVSNLNKGHYIVSCPKGGAPIWSGKELSLHCMLARAMEKLLYSYNVIFLLQDFRLEFCFSDNEWFTNKILVKSYKVSCEVNKEDPWSFEGASITSSEG